MKNLPVISEIPKTGILRDLKTGLHCVLSSPVPYTVMGLLSLLHSSLCLTVKSASVHSRGLVGRSRGDWIIVDGSRIRISCRESDPSFIGRLKRPNPSYWSVFDCCMYVFGVCSPGPLGTGHPGLFSFFLEWQVPDFSGLWQIL
ncbi:MAG: hypothetical protein CM1200mP22_33520 [Dehalococcoidia bacterium]|nr:MAG: hypothetical protein CM1200mP22_33520 [Dehalococcoidia bacterium]